MARSSGTPLTSLPTNEALFSARAPGSKTAIVVDESALTYDELDALASGYLERLATHGVKAGDRVGVWTVPTLETIVALYAHAKHGITSVPINANVGERELLHIVNDAQPRALVAAESSALSIKLSGAPVLPTRLEKGTTPSVFSQATHDAPLLVLYTSGTTGAPKGAVLSIRNAASNLDALAQVWNWSSDDTVVHALPLFHVHGLVLGLFGALRRGGTLRFVPKFDEARLCAALHCTSTVLFAVPTMYHRLIAAAQSTPSVAAGLKAARLLVSGSAGMPVRDHLRIEELTGRRVVERYGLTETLINCSVHANAMPTPGRVGPALPGIELKLVDDTRRPIATCDDTTLGEIAVRGPNVFEGYLNREDATRTVLDEEGFFYTGDLATVDQSGSVRIVGRRATDLIKTGGYKVGAGEVEAAILEHASVSECAVIGVDDEDLGERIVAYVVLHKGADAISEHTIVEHTTSMISAHKRPRRVHFVEALPRNAMGKVVKNELRKRVTP